jgi:hypothetical protein
METTFTQLNDGWNAEPNGPEPKAEWQGDNLILRFYMNPYQFPEYQEGDIGEIVFRDCSRYRLGTLNDEGWYRGQSRWAGVQHAWGEFYQVVGDLRLSGVPDDWKTRDPNVGNRDHFIFYFRDEDFECDARAWELKIIRAEPGH